MINQHRSVQNNQNIHVDTTQIYNGHILNRYISYMPTALYMPYFLATYYYSYCAYFIVLYLFEKIIYQTDNYKTISRRSNYKRVYLISEHMRVITGRRKII